jgi:hypothetical protein
MLCGILFRFVSSLSTCRGRGLTAALLFRSNGRGMGRSCQLRGSHGRIKRPKPERPWWGGDRTAASRPKILAGFKATVFGRSENFPHLRLIMRTQGRP